MPVDLRTHDPSDAIHIDPRTNKAAIIGLLYTNLNYGFTPAEIHDELDEIPKGSITGTLTRLLSDGDIGKTADGYYHALESRDNLRRFARSHVQLHNLTDRYDDSLSPADIEQTGANPTSDARAKADQHGNDTAEPAPEEWIEPSNDTDQE